MTENTIHDIRLSEISDVYNAQNRFSKLGNDYMYYHIGPRPDSSDIRNFNEFAQMPKRFEGMLFALIRDSHVTIRINTDTVRIEPHSLLIIPPGYIVSVVEADITAVNSDILLISGEFIRSVSLDIKTLSSVSIIKSDNRPSIPLTRMQSDLLAHYFELIHLNTISNSDVSQGSFARNITRCILTALLYQVLTLLSSLETEQSADDDSNEAPLTRRANYAQEFMRLAYANYRSERSLRFYADKLCISPKYLSLVVKESTGRSAAEWIDQMVILEAKNLLRYSGMNIQQVAYALNFANQSSFGKYFKLGTGMSPSQFIRS